MQGGLPDPEERRYLLAGTVEGVLTALSPQLAKGLIIVSSDDLETCIANPNGDSNTFPTNQMLKYTVRAANTLLGE